MKVSEITGLKVSPSGDLTTAEGDISITDDGLNLLVKSYCRESGVRNLRKQIEKIFRKAAFTKVKEGKTDIKIDKENLESYVGKPIYTRDKMYETKTAAYMKSSEFYAFNDFICLCSWKYRNTHNICLVKMHYAL